MSKIVFNTNNPFATKTEEKTMTKTANTLRWKATDSQLSRAVRNKLNKEAEAMAHAQRNVTGAGQSFREDLVTGFVKNTSKVQFSLDPEEVNFDLVKGLRQDRFGRLVIQQRKLAKSIGAYEAQANSAIGWVIRKPLRQKRKLIEGLGCAAILNGLDRATAVDGVLREIEALYAPFQDHAYTLSATVREPIVFHPWEVLMDVTPQDDVYVDALDCVDEFEGGEEDDDYSAELWLDSMMRQSELRTRSENVVDAMTGERDRQYSWWPCDREEKRNELMLLDEEGLKKRAKAAGWEMLAVKAKAYLADPKFCEVVGYKLADANTHIPGTVGRRLARRLKRVVLDSIVQQEVFQEIIESIEERHIARTQAAEDTPSAAIAIGMSDSRFWSDGFDDQTLDFQVYLAQAAEVEKHARRYLDLDAILTKYVEPNPYRCYVAEWAPTEQELHVLKAYKPEVRKLEIEEGQADRLEFTGRWSQKVQLWEIKFSDELTEEQELDAARFVNTIQQQRRNERKTMEAARSHKRAVDQAMQGLGATAPAEAVDAADAFIEAMMAELA